MLPTPLAWTRKVLKILKSDLSPNQIAFGFSLGVFAGLPPMGLHVIIPCSLALFARCSFRSFLFSMGLFKLISLALAPAAYAIGKWILDSSRGLDSFWRWAFHLPVIAPMGYGRYLLFGSLLVSLLIAIPVFLLVRLLVLRYRKSFATRVSQWTVSRRVRNNRTVALLRRLFAGGEAKYDTSSAPRGPFRYLRAKMLIGLPIGYAVCYLLAALIVPLFAGTIATSTATWVSGTDVSVRGSSFNLFTGELSLDGLSIQDPDVPEENLAEIPRITINTGMVPLLSKQVVLNNVVIADLSVHVKRESDGTLNIDNATSGWNADGYVEWATEHATEVDWLGLLRRFLAYLEETRPLAPRGDPYAPYRGGRSFAPSHPWFSIDRIEIGRVLISLRDELEPAEDRALPPVTLIEVELSNLAFPVNLRSGPMLVRLHGQWGDDPQSGFELSAQIDETGRTYAFSITRLDLPQLARIYATTLAVSVESGRASLVGTLRQEAGETSGDISFLLEDFRIRGYGDRPLFGLSSEASERVIDGINRYAEEVPIVFGSRIDGSSASPKLAWEAPLLEVAKQGLLMAGRHELESTIEQLELRIDGLGGVEGIPLAPAYAALDAETENAVQRILGDAAGGLLEHLSIPAPETESATESDPATVVNTLLKGLFPGPNSPGDDSETDPQ